MIVVVACVVSKSLEALVEVVIFLDFDFMYVYLFPALECTVWSCNKNNPMYVFYTCPCMYSTTNISGGIILSSDICGFILQSPLPHNAMIWCVAIWVNDSKGESSPLAQ